jgi:hypothetical protein
MDLLQWIFPFGAALTFVGFLSELLLRWDASHGFRMSGYIGLTMPLCLLIGALLMIAGFITDLRRLPALEARRRAWFCWGIAALSIILMIFHHWGFDDTAVLLSLPAFCGFAGGFVLFLFS